jgi:hypothetical protein
MDLRATLAWLGFRMPPRNPVERGWMIYGYISIAKDISIDMDL